jgi:8-oxo-dGTP diphosphatase
VQSADGETLPLAFDHETMLGVAMLRLRGKLDYSALGFALLPGLFTLRALQDVHEAILGVRLNKPAFRRRMLDRGWLEPTGERETGASFRPAELYRYRNPSEGAE